MIFFYRLLTNILYPILIIFIYLRKIFNKEDKNRYKEKIFPSSFDVKKDDKKKLIWFHAASIGEVQSIFPLVEKINEEKKDLNFLITTVTLSAGNIVKKKLNKFENVTHRYFPIDILFIIKRFLEKWKPDLIIFVDSEIWPNLIFEIKKGNIPVILINGRITKKTFKKWMLAPNFAKMIFNKFDLCLAASKESEENLKRLNAKNLKFIGNIKFTGKLQKGELVDKNLEILKSKTSWCAASTHRGEEIICLKTHISLKDIYKDVITIIIPRHINRSLEISQLCKKYKLSSQILNENETIQDSKEIIIVNSFGSLSKFYNYSKNIFIGKSMIKQLEKVGGQNPIEAAKLGCKIYHGPYIYNFKEIYDLLKSYKISNEIHKDIDLFNRLAVDLKDSDGEQNKMSESIKDLGQKILNKTNTEVNNFLI